MPSISTPSKIAGTQKYSPNVLFSGSVSQEREAKVAEVQAKTNAIFVPPYDHPDIILGQGTASYELSGQYAKAKAELGQSPNLRAVLTPCGGGGLLSGTVTWFSDKPTYVFGAEPSYQGANDLQRGLAASPPTRIETVKTLTIADGLRTPVGKIPWSVLTNGSSTKPKFLEGVYSVDEEQIKQAMKLVLERLKVFIEPSSAVPLAVVLYDREWRKWVVEKQKEEGTLAEWDVAIIFSGGNTTIDAIVGLFGADQGKVQQERAEGVVGSDGERVAENVPG
jgi:threonine dehydratase